MEHVPTCTDQRATEHLINTVADAPWLPAGSRAEAWVGDECTSFESAIIVRLLLTRQSPGGREFFTIPTQWGDDLPTLSLSREVTLDWDVDRMSPGEGLTLLLERTVGALPPTRCVGFIRNVVPHPDEEYPHPVPHAHVPVFAVLGDATPTIAGTWYTLDGARDCLSLRHWWPIVANHLAS